MLPKFIENLFLPKISDWVSPDDALSWYEFDYGAIDWVNISTLPDVTKGIVLAFNQWKYTKTKQACTIVNSMRSLMQVANAVYGYQPKNQDIFDAVDYAITQWYVVGKWWFVYKGIDAARNRWNSKHPDMQMTSYTITSTDPDFPKLKLKWYRMVGSYSGSDAYNRDYRADAVLDWASFWPRTYGHCTIQEAGPQINDSYAGNSYNIYKLMQPDALVTNGVWNTSFFFFAPKNDNSAEIKRLQGIIADCTSQNEIWYRLIKNTNDKDFQVLQSKLIEANLKKIDDAKEWLKDL